MEYSTEEYRRAYVEVLAAIAKLDDETRSRIPDDRLAHMEAERDPDYEFELNMDIPIKLQLSKLSQELVAYIYYNYICTDAMRESIDIRKAAAGQQ